MNSKNSLRLCDGTGTVGLDFRELNRKHERWNLWFGREGANLGPACRPVAAHDNAGGDWPWAKQVLSLFL